MNKEGMSLLEDKITVLTKRIATLNESLKNDRLMRLMMIKKQCEDVSMPLDCKDFENDSPKEKVECKPDVEMEETDCLEVSLLNETRDEIAVVNGNCEGKECDALVSYEPKYVCVEAHEEGLKEDEPELDVEVLKFQPFKVSVVTETKMKNLTHELLCNCEGCVKESQDQGLSEMLGFQGSKDVTVDGDEGRWGSSHTKKFQEKVSHFIPSSNVQNLNFSCKTESWFMMAAMKGISIVVFTPHFHYYMLLKLMISLDHLGVVICCFELRIGVLCLSLGNLFIMVFIGKGKCIPSLWNDEFDANDVGIAASCVVIRPRHFIVIFDPGGNKVGTIL